MTPIRICRDCDSPADVSRREFLRTAGAAAIVAGTTPLWAQAADTTSAGSPESISQTLYESLKPEQRKVICFDWDHMDKERGLLRTRVANNWNITEPNVTGEFYTKDQQQMIREIFEGIIHPEWHERIYKQLEDDAGGYGNEQSIALFGKPGEKFEFVMTGRHMTIRADGNSAEHVAFGGPIFYGHAAQGFNEEPNHPGNVFWPQGLAANKVFEMLDGKQREKALVAKLPREQDSGFRADGLFPGIPLSEMTPDQRSLVAEVMTKLVEPYRPSDRQEAMKCLESQGGLEKCSLAFYSDEDLGNDKIWDCWRLEGPSFVWYFRGSPHVHVWVNVADDPSVKLNA